MLLLLQKYTTARIVRSFKEAKQERQQTDHSSDSASKLANGFCTPLYDPIHVPNVGSYTSLMLIQIRVKLLDCGSHQP